MNRIYRLFRDARGATAIEYALVASLVSVAALAGYQGLGGSVNQQYTDIESRL